MKNLILLLLICISLNNFFAQKASLTTYFSSVIDTNNYFQLANVKRGYEDNIILTPFNKSQNSKFIKNINQLIRDSSDSFIDYFWEKNSSIYKFKKGDNIINIEGEIFLIDKTKPNSLFYNDSIQNLINEMKLDSNGYDYLYDSIGDPVIELTTISEPIEDKLVHFSSLESWCFIDGHFTKKSYLNNLSIIYSPIGTFDYANEYLSRTLFMTNPEKKSKINKKEPFIKNLSYNYLYTPLIQYDTILMLLYENDYYFHTPSSAEYFINYWEEKKTLTPNYKYQDFNKVLIKSILNRKIKVLTLNDQKIPDSRIDSLFCIYQKTPKYNENYEALYDSNGNVIYEEAEYPLSYTDIVGYQFTENWYLAKNQFDIVKKVKYISFLVKEKHKNGNMKTEPKVLPFKIIFND